MTTIIIPARARVAYAMLAGALLLAPLGRADAQADAPHTPEVQVGPSSRTLACVRALPPSAFSRTYVFVHAEVVDSADALARSAVDLVAQEVAARVRAALWRTPETAAAADGAGRLPAIDSVFGRVFPEGKVRVTAERGGRVRWRVAARVGSDSVPVALVERALRSAHSEGAVIVVDDLLRGDSLAFELRFAYAAVPAPGRARDTLRVRNPFPVFTALLPQEKQAWVRGRFSLNYPSELQRSGFEGKVVVSFVVDTAGRAEPRTFRDAYPAVAAALKPNLRGAYAMFLDAVRDGVLRARYFPAEVGGCPVRQLVQQPVTFKLQR